MKTIKKVKLYELIMLIANGTPPERIIYKDTVYTYNEDYQDYKYKTYSLFKIIFSNDKKQPFDIIVEIIEEN